MAQTQLGLSQNRALVSFEFPFKYQPKGIYLKTLLSKLRHFFRNQRENVFFLSIRVRLVQDGTLPKKSLARLSVSLKSQKQAGYPDATQRRALTIQPELRRRISETISGRDCPLRTFIYPGFEQVANLGVGQN